MTNPIAKALPVLQLFDEKAAKLERSLFTEFIRKESVGFSFDYEAGNVNVYVRGPHPEAVDAFVLTLRFFVQDNEATSFRNMEKLYKTLPVSTELITQLQEARAKINAFLDSNSMFEIAGKKLLNREIFEVFLWGGLAHANGKLKERFDAWASDEYLFPLINMEFHSILAEVLRFTFWLRDHNEFAMRELKALSPSG